MSRAIDRGRRYPVTYYGWGSWFRDLIKRAKLKDGLEDNGDFELNRIESLTRPKTGLAIKADSMNNR
jgi:hypothetical protein